MCMRTYIVSLLWYATIDAMGMYACVYVSMYVCFCVRTYFVCLLKCKQLLMCVYACEIR
jgi:hypothetical protein